METDLVREIEELASNAWRPEIEQHLGGWRLRYTGGHSRRVNSVFPSSPPAALPLETCLDLVEDFYRRRGMPPRFQLCPAALPANLHAILETRGYTFSAHTAMKTQTIARLLEKIRDHPGRIESENTLTDAWFNTYTTASGYDPESLPIRRGILSRIGPKAQFVLVNHDGKPAATGLGVAERGWLGVFCVVTDPAHRRKGLASAVMRALAFWGRSQNAERVYLQVMENNPAGLSLYDMLGFKKLYQYYYAENVRDADETD
ncbi:MAG: GNAT family N-acetyltransferase [Anaerolineales bacterium]|jgi:ribosomal protein S18 acetylase RimI-like enzyme